MDHLGVDIASPDQAKHSVVEVSGSDGRLGGIVLGDLEETRDMRSTEALQAAAKTAQIQKGRQRVAEVVNSTPPDYGR